MYHKILLALDATSADRTLLAHIVDLAKFHGSKLLLVHVADGWAARHFDALKLAESEEIKEDRAYLERVAGELKAQGLEVTTRLAMGNPPDEILKTSAAEQCDLIAMTSHGHRFLADIVLGSTIEAVRHRTHTPLLIVRAD
ncbi:MAG TPA: universal stress protein [Tepidisphaeraceae bacterium]|jgi:nucleotide-binding universal stress UspA family protein